MVKHMKLTREKLAAVDMFAIVLDALEQVATLPEGDQAHEYANRLLVLLPTHARNRHVFWTPSGDDPDEWARCGAYRGAFYGRRLEHVPPLEARTSFPDGLCEVLYTHCLTGTYFAARRATETKQCTN